MDGGDRMPAEPDAKDKCNDKPPVSNYDEFDFTASFNPASPLPSQEDETKQLQSLQERLVTLPDGAVTTSSHSLGRGAFGVVTVGKYQGQPVAVKEFNPTGVALSKLEALQAFEWETSCLSTLHHSNLVRFYGVYMKRERTNGKEVNKLCMVMELCKERNLAQYLGMGEKNKQPVQNEVSLSTTTATANIYSAVDLDKEAEYGTSIPIPIPTANPDDDDDEEINEITNYYSPQLPSTPLNNPQRTRPTQTLPEAPPMGWPMFWRVALDMAHGLAYLHEQGTLHRDFKSENVLFDFQGRAKLTDLGVAQVDGLLQTSEAQIVSRNMKDYGYAAPEEFMGTTTAKSDMFSYGLVLCEMLQGKILNSRYDREKQKLETIPPTCFTPIRDLIEKCWKINPEERPTAREVIERLEACHAECKVTEWDSLLPRLEQELEPQQAALREYVPPYIKQDKEENGNEKAKVTIETALDNFLIDRENRVLVVLGEGGLGKSLSTYRLAQQLIEQHRQRMDEDPPSWLPLFIRAAIPTWHHTALQDGLRQTLAHYGLPQHSFESSEVRDQLLVFILDGYDELSGKPSANLPAVLGLQHLPNAKLIISTRPTLMSTLSEKLGLKGVCTVHKLLPFTKNQRLAFLHNTLHWDEEQQQWFSDQLSNAPELAKALKNPFVLHIFAQSWETQRKQNLQHLTTHEIYEACIRHWVDTYSPVLPLPLYQRLLGDNPLQSAKDWLMESALIMAKDQTLSLSSSLIKNSAWSTPSITKTLNSYASKRFQDRLDAIAVKSNLLTAAVNPKEQATLTQELKALERRSLMSLHQYQSLLLSRAQRFLDQAPLKQRTDRLQFIHKSLWEYCTACGIHHSLAHSTDQPAQALRFGLSPEFILQDASVLSFLAALTSAQDCAHWESWLKASKHSVSAAPVAACAITALNGLQLMKKFQYQFPSDLTGIRIPGADLRGALLDGIQFDDSDLSNIQFTCAWLANASFARAELEGTQFGEYPSLRLREKVKCCCYSHDGTQLAVLIDKVVHLYKPGTAKLTGRFTVGDEVDTIAFSPDGWSLASGAGSDVHVWDAHNGNVVRKFKGHTQRVTSVAVSPDDKYIASASQDNSIRMWESSSSWGLTLWVKSNVGPVFRVAFSSDSKTLVSGCGLGWITIWDVASGTSLHQFQHGQSINCVQFSPNGKFIVSGSMENLIKLWSVKGSLLWEHTQSTNSVAFSHDSKLIAAGGEDCIIRLYTRTGGEILREFKGHSDQINSVTFSPDGQNIASGSNDGFVRVWKVESSLLPLEPDGHTDPVKRVAFSPDGTHIASESSDNSVRMWTAASGTLLWALKGRVRHVISVGFCFSLNGKYLVSASDNCVRLWDAATGTSLWEKEHTQQVQSIAFSLDSKWIVSATDLVRVWETATGTTLWELKATNSWDGKEVTCVAFSPSGEWIAGARNNVIHVWNAKSGAVVWDLKRHTGKVTSLSWSPNPNNLIASGSEDFSIVLWVPGESSSKKFSGTDMVKEVTFSPDGKYLVSLQRMDWIRVWDVKSGVFREVQMEKPLGVVWSPNSRHLAAWSTTEIGLWDPEYTDFRKKSGIAIFSKIQSGSATNCLHWNTQPNNELSLVTGHEDCSVRLWRVVENSDFVGKLQLVWSTARLALMVDLLQLDGAQGLSTANAALLKQRGAFGKPIKGGNQRSTIPPPAASTSPQDSDMINGHSSNDRSGTVVKKPPKCVIM